MCTYIYIYFVFFFFAFFGLNVVTFITRAKAVKQQSLFALFAHVRFVFSIKIVLSLMLHHVLTEGKKHFSNIILYRIKLHHTFYIVLSHKFNVTLWFIAFFLYCTVLYHDNISYHTVLFYFIAEKLYFIEYYNTIVFFIMLYNITLIICRITIYHIISQNFVVSYHIILYNIA